MIRLSTVISGWAALGRFLVDLGVDDVLGGVTGLAVGAALVLLVARGDLAPPPRGVDADWA